MKGKRMIQNHEGRPFVIILLITMILSMSIRLRAQETKVVRDLHLWTGIALEKTVAKDWTFSLGQEIRFKHDISEINNFFTEPGIEYRINKNFSLGANYRFTRDRKKDLSYETRTRYNFDLKYKGKLEFLNIYYRLRYQKEVDGFNLVNPRVPYEKYLRHRLTLRMNKMKLGHVKPYVSAEIFQLFEPFKPSRYDYVRLMVGARYKPSSSSEFKLAWGLNRELVPDLPATVYLIQANYTYSF